MGKNDQNRVVKTAITKGIKFIVFILVRGSELSREEFNQAEYFFLLYFFCQETVYFASELNH